VISQTRVLELMQGTMSSLHRSGIVAIAIEIQPETVLLGAGSPLDSLGFVTFVTELESRLEAEAGEDVALVFEEIHEFNASNPHLSAGTLSEYIADLTAAA
jgi:acyl carrier protein